MRTQRGIQVMNQCDVSCVIKRCAFGQQTHLGENALGFFMSRFSEQNSISFFIFSVITRHLNDTFTVGRFFTNLQCQQGWQCIDLAVHLGMIFRLTRNDQRRTRFIDQNRIDFIDNRK